MLTGRSCTTTGAFWSGTLPRTLQIHFCAPDVDTQKSTKVQRAQIVIFGVQDIESAAKIRIEQCSVAYSKSTCAQIRGSVVGALETLEHCVV